MEPSRRRLIRVSPDKPKPVAQPATAVGPELLGQLFARHGAALELFARQWCDTPEDVVQQALLQLARQSAAPRQIVAWLYRVVRNGALSAARSEQRRRRHETAAAQLARPWFAEHEGAAFDAAAAAIALESLAASEREVIVARLWGGLTFQEIAEVAGLSASTAHRHYESGLRKLREKLASSDIRQK
jgi:RNA polymerase sigma-70 factor (ECF subfamily)